jgi:hypothetical protein
VRRHSGVSVVGLAKGVRGCRIMLEGRIARQGERSYLALTSLYRAYGRFMGLISIVKCLDWHHTHAD